MPYNDIWDTPLRTPERPKIKTDILADKLMLLIAVALRNVKETKDKASEPIPLHLIGGLLHAAAILGIIHILPGKIDAIWQVASFAISGAIILVNYIKGKKAQQIINKTTGAK